LQFEFEIQLRGERRIAGLRSAIDILQLYILESFRWFPRSEMHDTITSA
jgi:hypothetical protein